MLTMLIAWDEQGNVAGVGHYLVQVDERGDVVGLVDFEAVEDTGHLRLTEDGSQGVWHVGGAAGSGTWPEWIGGNDAEPGIFDFRIQVDRRFKRPIRALVHRKSGHRRDRVAIEREIERRLKEEERAARAEEREARAVDIRDLVGGPGLPLMLDGEGRNRPRFVPANRPVMSVRSG